MTKQQGGQVTTVGPGELCCLKGKEYSVGTERPGAVRSVLYRAAMVVSGAPRQVSHRNLSSERMDQKVGEME